MVNDSGSERRRGDRRGNEERRKEDRRLNDRRRQGERREANMPVKQERRSGTDRRGQANTQLPIRDHIIVHAVRRLVARLTRIAQTRPEYEEAQLQIAHMSVELGKSEPDLQLLANMLYEMRGGITRLEDYERADEMLRRFRVNNKRVRQAASKG